jgi:glucan biosynthesis protein C
MVTIHIAKRRLLFLDNIRWSMVILVLTMHASDTYSPFGNWYYTDRASEGPFSTIFFAVYQSFLQAFFMGLLFFVAGYFTVPSLERKGALDFISDRFIRLGIPTLLYMFVIGPLTQYFLSHTWGSGGFGHQWLTHFRDGEWLSESGPMWFCALLLCFSIAYPALRIVRPESARQILSSPSNWAFGGFLAAMAVLTFLVRVVVPENVTTLNVHLGDCPQYVLMFGAGAVAHRAHWLDHVRGRFAKHWAAATLVASVPLLILLILLRPSLGGNTQLYNGGFNWISATKCLWEALVCMGMSLTLIAYFYRRFDRQGRCSSFLSKNAFAVYLFHPPILIAVAIMLHPLIAPPVAKAALLSILAGLVTFVLAAMVFHRVPLLRRVL